jgi:chitodextrinase
MNVFDYIGHNITTGVVDGIPKQIHLYNARKCSVNSGNNCNSWPSGVPVDGEPWITKTSQWMPFTGDGITSCGETEGGGYLTSVACVNHSIAVITLDEYNAWKAGGEIAGIGIDHALDLTAPQSRGPYHCNHRYPSPGGLGQAETTSPLYPGNEACCHNCGGTSLDPGVDTGPELGIRLQILPTYNCNQHADLTKAICQAWQKYGAIYTEHTSAHDMYINIESVLPPRSWYGAHYEGLPKNWLNYMRIVLPVCIIGTECNTANDGGAAICSGSNQNFNCITGGIDSQNPTTPRSPQAQAHATQAEVTISWIASTDNVAVDHYNIYWCSGVDCTPTTLISPIVYPDTSYVHNGLTSATLYRYQIEAVDTSDNKSDKTAIIEATTPTPSAPDYTLKKKGQVITIDGNCNEYAYANTLTVTPAAGGNIATVYLLWDEVNGDLYGCADIQDTDLQCSVQPRDGLYYVNDAIAFSFDTANDKGSANDNDDYKFAIDLAGIQSDSRQLNVGWSTTWLSAVAYAGTLNDAIPDVGWSAEWKISYADWGVSVPEVDDVYGMEVELWDKDGY